MSIIDVVQLCKWSSPKLLCKLTIESSTSARYSPHNKEMGSTVDGCYSLRVDMEDILHSLSWKDLQSNKHIAYREVQDDELRESLFYETKTGRKKM